MKDKLLTKTINTQKLLWLLLIYIIFLCVNAFFMGPHFDSFYYWSWGQHLDFGYLDGPPLIA